MARIFIICPQKPVCQASCLPSAQPVQFRAIVTWRALQGFLRSRLRDSLYSSLVNPDPTCTSTRPAGNSTKGQGGGTALEWDNRTITMTKQGSRWATSLPLLPIASAAEGPPRGGGGQCQRQWHFFWSTPLFTVIRGRQWADRDAKWSLVLEIINKTLILKDSCKFGINYEWDDDKTR